MKIAVIGAGAVGLFLASTLEKEGQEVTIFSKSLRQAELIMEHGISLVGKLKCKKQIAARISDDAHSRYDLIIVAVKSYHVESVLANNRSLANEGASWLFVQNGMAHLQQLSRLSDHVYVGVLEYGLFKKKELPSVEVRGIGQLKIAPYSRVDKRVTACLKMAFTSELLQVEWEDQYKEMLEKKLIVNACINPLTAILGVTNGALIEIPGYKRAMKDVFIEAMAAINRTDTKERWEHVLTICEQTKENHSSMFVDAQQGRQLELDAIIGYIMQQGKQHQVTTPKIDMLYHLLNKGHCS
ncbi:2-dehydropantoate 2-reductase [Shouchella patagoniensis]|uniref:2-dehydropantoate 2-reductase n=1 Tax=Shouchella patagoniensis TaxID=228576 RepID=UPI001474A2F6|nr:2-dehydropantoate 2-reductase [Shouchella patagoniensis]